MVFHFRLLSLLLGLGVLGASNQIAKADFVQVLADRLGTKPEFLVINLPPRPAAWPGAIFTDDLRLPIVRGKADDPAFARGDPINIEATSLTGIGASSAAGWGTIFSIAAKAADIAQIIMSFPDARIID